uniref:AlgX/AlgJ SGNH hydrolase-like domain-containing protein n=1 Tax=Eubacterium cellulosolvens (strain ATCC 43171 / JCM 9499 / 6) TaxID=633697 RepID=I5ARI4_EUBC6
MQRTNKRRRGAATKEQRRKRKLRFLRKWHAKTLTVLFLAMVAGFVIVNMATKDRTFSENENRNLAQKPKLSAATVKDGSYFKDFSSYLNDQFFGRDRWLTLNLLENTFLGRKEAGEVYLGKNGYLLEKANVPDEEQMKLKETAIRDFWNEHQNLNMNMVLVPCAGAVYPKLLPKNAPFRDQIGDISEEENSLMDTGIKFTRLSDAFRAHGDEQLYYKTDHHWTSAGAGYALAEMAGNLGILDPETSYDSYTVSGSFQGTLASKSGRHSVADEIRILVPKTKMPEYYVYYPDTQTSTTSVYIRSKLKEKDQYQVFFGGNHPAVEIHTTADTGKNILIFKDSYANAFVPLLIPYYDNIIMIDPRYYYEDVNQVISSAEITDVLFLYSQNTFATDTTLTDVLNSGRKDAASGSGTESLGSVSSSSVDFEEDNLEDLTVSSSSEE